MFIISTQLRGSYRRDYIFENINKRRADCHGSCRTALFCIYCLSFSFVHFSGGVGQALHCSDPLSASTPACHYRITYGSKRVSRNLTPCQLIFTLVVVIRFSTYECLLLPDLVLLFVLRVDLQCVPWLDLSYLRIEMGKLGLSETMESLKQLCRNCVDVSKQADIQSDKYWQLPP